MTQIIPANPGIRTIYQEENGKLFLSDHVVAWLITTEKRKDSTDVVVDPITTSGTADGGHWGYMFPSGTVENWERTFPSLEEAKKR